jgi:hypothetical protein
LSFGELQADTYWYYGRVSNMCNGRIRKLPAAIMAALFVLSVLIAPVNSAGPGIQITPEQNIEPTIIIPEIGPADAVFGGWVIWAILVVFGIVVLISLIIRGGSPRRNS